MTERGGTRGNTAAARLRLRRWSMAIRASRVAPCTAATASTACVTTVFNLIRRHPMQSILGVGGDV